MEPGPQRAASARADFAQLYLPPLMDPVYGFQAVNVEAQQRNPSSFLHWMRPMLQTRKQLPVFGTGVRLVACANPSVLAYVRSTCTVLSPRTALRSGRRGAAEGTRNPGALCPQSEPIRPARRARPGPLGRSHARRAARAGTVPARDRWADPHDARALRLLLVRARRGGVTTAEPTPDLEGLVSAYVARRPGWSGVGGRVTSVDDEVLVDGRPGIRDVVAEVGGTLVHLALGLKGPGEEPKVLAGVEEPILGVYDDPRGVAVAFDAVRDADTASLLLQAVTGRTIEPDRVRQVRFDTSSATLAFDNRLDFTIFDRLVNGPHPGLELLVGLDSVGFNHVAPPVAVWRRGGHDLGVVQEHLAGGSSGWAMARTSVRDLYDARVAPEEAGGDFASEARRLGMMTARMHLALVEAFGRRDSPVSVIAAEIGSRIAETAPSMLDRPDLVQILSSLSSSEETCAIVRAHGDFHLGRVWRAEQGWMVVELTAGEHPVNRPGGVPGDADLDADVGPGPIERTPLGDVADMVWSFGTVAAVAAARRDPDDREGLGPLGLEWMERNRAAFLGGYNGVPEISALIPTDRRLAGMLLALFELDRLAGRIGRGRDG